MLKGFHHAAISTPDLARSVRFYQEMFGCTVVREFGWPAGVPAADALTGLRNSAARAVMLKLGDSYLEIFEFSSPVPKPGDPDRPACDHGLTHLCIEVRDSEAEYRRLAAAGMRFHAPPQAQEGGFVTYGRDPDGNIVELLEFGTP
ncbi:MAG: VOC family protein [Gammaproteobacteria bacterium]|jgi:glyoxylase I family protein|nr:VOC family protein [Gammaproteobacteria bacterium]